MEQSDTEIEPEPKADVTYLVSILSATEALKTKARQTPKTAIITLTTGDPWVTFQAHVKHVIVQSISPLTINYDDYDMSFYINKKVPKPGMSLTNEVEYQYMTGKATKANDNDVNLVVVQKPTGKENLPEAAPEKLKKGSVSFHQDNPLHFFEYHSYMFK